jgi:hypothetical protein
LLTWLAAHSGFGARISVVLWSEAVGTANPVAIIIVRAGSSRTSILVSNKEPPSSPDIPSSLVKTLADNGSKVGKNRSKEGGSGEDFGKIHVVNE